MIAEAICDIVDKYGDNLENRKKSRKEEYTAVYRLNLALSFSGERF